MTDMQQIVVKTLPKGPLEAAHFEVQTVPRPEPGPNQVLLRTILMSIDAANRSWLQGATYRAAVKAGDLMPTFAVSEVVESTMPRFQAGDIVVSEGVWAEYHVQKSHHCQKVHEVPRLENLMSVFGIAGKTAYHGLVGVGRPMAGETLVVSAAAGSVGGYVGQIGKALGCRVVGIAGGPEKCDWVTQHLGFDACIDYRADGLYKSLRRACPDGVDVYFDNVGGDVLESTLALMNERGRVVCCGAISQYDTGDVAGPRNLPGVVVIKRLRMEGFIVTDHAREDAKALRALQAWVAQGKLKVEEDVYDGLASAPDALIGLLAGDNRGKRMVRVGPDP